MNSPFHVGSRNSFSDWITFEMETKQSPKYACILLSSVQKKWSGKDFTFPLQFGWLSWEGSQMVLMGTCPVMSLETCTKLLQLLHTVIQMIIRNSSLFFLACPGLVNQSMLSFTKDYDMGWKESITDSTFWTSRAKASFLSFFFFKMCNIS